MSKNYYWINPELEIVTLKEDDNNKTTYDDFDVAVICVIAKAQELTGRLEIIIEKTKKLKTPKEAQENER